MSPSKVKPPVIEQRKRISSQDGLETLKNDFRKVNIYTLEKNVSSGSDLVICTKYMRGSDFRKFCLSYMEMILLTYFQNAKTLNCFWG